MSRDLSTYYTADERRALAKATESAVFQCLLNAEGQPEKEGHWRAHADRLERNFTADFGRHYSYFTAPLATTAEEISVRIYARDGFTPENFLREFESRQPSRSRQRWRRTAPTEPGRYLLRCGENDFEPEEITITRERRSRGEFLIADCPHLGKTALPHYHDGLTEPSWKKLENQR